MTFAATTTMTMTPPRSGKGRGALALYSFVPGRDNDDYRDYDDNNNDDAAVAAWILGGEGRLAAPPTG
uniref:Uncharacterized protein n=1 Tax=Oryza sativa subsp. japonica TaxID=39947 RepID=Q6Z1M4_ORYSJ|nr:hypothetical protein [Oryza sativa Japonica Group]